MDLIRERLRASGHHLACIGGDSSSSSDKLTEQVDRRVSGGSGGAQISGDSNTVTVNAVDHGAVYAGAELARAALVSNAQTLQGALQGLEKAYETGRAGDQKIVSFVGLAVLGIAAVMVLPGLFKKG